MRSSFMSESGKLTPVFVMDNFTWQSFGLDGAFRHTVSVGCGAPSKNGHDKLNKKLTERSTDTGRIR